MIFAMSDTRAFDLSVMSIGLTAAAGFAFGPRALAMLRAIRQRSEPITDLTEAELAARLDADAAQVVTIVSPARMAALRTGHPVADMIGDREVSNGYGVCDACCEPFTDEQWLDRHSNDFDDVHAECCALAECG